MPRLPVSLALAAFIFFVPSFAQAEGGTKTFHGLACTKDCSGHMAGYNWAKKKNIRKEDDCHAKAKSFNEGCRLWVREQSQSAPNSAPEK